MAVPTGPGYGGTVSGFAPPAGSFAPGMSVGSGVMVWPMDRLVGFGTRLVATIIDWVAIGVISAILSALHLQALGSLLGTIYLIAFWATTGQTVGASAMKIKVVRTDGEPMTWGAAIIRYIGYVIACIPFCLGLLWIAWDPLKQGWQDKIASTVVVRVD